jgi:hypothetical protein
MKKLTITILSTTDRGEHVLPGARYTSPAGLSKRIDALETYTFFKLLPKLRLTTDNRGQTVLLSWNTDGHAIVSKVKIETEGIPEYGALPQRRPHGQTEEPSPSDTEGHSNESIEPPAA